MPPYVYSSGQEVVDLCAGVGVLLDPWQQFILIHGLGERADGLWSAFEVAEIVARQNGKGDVIMARELGGLLILEEDLILHTAHEFKTCSEAFRRIRMVIENSDELRRKFKKPRMTTGQEALETLQGSRLLFLARSASSGRGFTGDCVVLDEAQILTDDPIEAMLPTMSSIPNPQIWYAGTAGKQTSVHLGRVRARGIRGDDPALAYMEWSVDEDLYDPASPQDWAKANPALGIRISLDYVAKERSAMGAEGFARERLGVGDWPVDVDADFVIDPAVWALLEDAGSRLAGEVVFAVDVSPSRDFGAVAVAGRRGDGLLHVEIVDGQAGTGWIVARLAQLVAKHDCGPVVLDEGSPAGSLLVDLRAAGVAVEAIAGREMAQACGQFFDVVADKGLRHLGQPELVGALRGAAKRDLGDAWAWARRKSTANITPLVAATLAVHGFQVYGEGLGPADVTIRF